MQAGIFLTVSESKRLIAKAVAKLPEVQAAKTSGILVVSTGSTNAYVAEEILGRKMEKRGFLTGHFTPAKLDRSALQKPASQGDVVLQNGQEIKGKTKFEIVQEMGAQDVIIKGANALNYDKQLAGVAIGHPSGGTVGGLIGPVHARKIKWIIPVGLEKLVAQDIAATSQKLNAEVEGAKVYGLFPVFGKIVTEIEAVQILFGVEALHAGSGGIYGAEGGVYLVLQGEKEKVVVAQKAISEIQGEPEF